jgi:hypothetical protein
MTTMTKILQRICQGIVSCREEGEKPRELLVTELARPLLRDSFTYRHAAEQDTIYGVPVRWTIPRRNHPEMAIRTIGGDTRVIA